MRIAIFAASTFALALMASSMDSASAAPRQWKDATGQFSVAAELVEVKNGEVHLKKADGEVIVVSVSKLSDADRKLAEAQGVCVVMTESPLGSMGVPAKILVEGKSVFICCEGCREDVLKNPKETLAKAAELLEKSKK